MTVALTKPWTARQFLDWVATREGRYEFDGIRPVAMTGGNANHNRITLNIHRALDARLRGTPCAHFGPDLAIQTVGEKVRFPDALITCTKFPGTERIAPNPVAVFEVVSPTSGRDDRLVKLAEYQAVPAILAYIIVESAFAGALLYRRQTGGQSFSPVPLLDGSTLDLPDVGVRMPIAEFYEDVAFAEPADPEAGSDG